MIRNITLAGILVSLLNTTNVYAHIKMKNTHSQLDSILHSKGIIINNGFQENFKHKVLNDRQSTIDTSSRYTNIEFEVYSDAMNTIDSFLYFFKDNNFKVLSHCIGFSCGNSMALASKIQSDNFLSDKQKQQYILFYNDYNWFSLHLSSYENKTFIFYRSVFDKKLKNSLELLFINKNNFELSKEVIAKLDNYIMIINTNSKSYTVIGHTDSSGQISHNQVLSQKRAMRVYDYLISNGVNKDRLNVVYAGESTPLHSNKTITGRELNRRVELRESKNL
ncbi:OmpA family protein [Pseudoalteromonas neustonica]|uniref:OmpA family protein n=1 Tax=Pseudoalteromonas neustonica TaxID=1840331 RepID=A0ABU9U3X8_9GAMM